MKKIILVGAGGFAREVIWLIEGIKEYEIIGYVSNEKEDSINYPFFGNDDCLKLYIGKGIGVVVAIGSSKIRKKIVDKIKSMEFEFPNIIAENTNVGTQIKMGCGNIICCGSILTTGISIGDFNIINLACTIGHDVVIDDFITINPGCSISGNVTISRYTEVGTGTKIIQGIHIEETNIIGAGSVVIRDTDPSSTYIGVPAKKKRSRE